MRGDSTFVLDLARLSHVLAFDHSGSYVGGIDWKNERMPTDLLLTASGMFASTTVKPETGNVGDVLHVVGDNGGQRGTGCRVDPRIVVSDREQGMLGSLVFAALSGMGNRVYCTQATTPVVQVMDSGGRALAPITIRPPFYIAPVNRPLTKNWRPVGMDHGIQIGALVEEVALDCESEADSAGDLAQVIAPRQGVQLTTFATPYDCSSCAPHLAALDTLRARGTLPKNDVIVIWSPSADLEREVAIVREKTPRTVCVDPRGALWDRHDLQHTPITLLLVDGRVTYMNDRMLASESEHRAFLADLAKFAKRD